MNRREHEFIASEITQLEDILSAMPPDRVVERTGLERRLEKARKKLEGVPVPPRPGRAWITLQGEDKGVNPALAGRVISILAQYAALAVAGETGELKNAGRIPREGRRPTPPLRHDRRAKGHPGRAGPSTPPGRTGDGPALRAVRNLQDLLEACLEGTERELEHTVGRIQPRAARKAAELLEMLKASGVWMSLEMERRETELGPPDDVERAARRLAERNKGEGEQRETE